MWHSFEKASVDAQENNVMTPKEGNTECNIVVHGVGRRHLQVRDTVNEMKSGCFASLWGTCRCQHNHSEVVLIY
jgi:hypothetical protein